jgi:hypothetical protein
MFELVIKKLLHVQVFSKIVSPVPGRIIAYDGRTLHTTRPASIWAPVPRITLAFRARLK